MNELLEMAETVFGDAWDAAGEGLDADLWRTCEETGLARLTLRSVRVRATTRR